MRHFQKWDESRRMGLNRYAKGGRPYDLIARSENAAQKPTRAPEPFYRQPSPVRPKVASKR